MIDTHCHLTYDPLLTQLDRVLTRAREAGVDRMISVGTTPTDARSAAGLAREHSNIYATVGLHPHYVQEWTDRNVLVEAMVELSRQPRVVALGEMGLDRHYPDPPIDLQRRAFEWQLEFAAASNLPIIIHNREATDETIAMIRASGIPGERFVFHCFTGEEHEHDAIMQLGAMISFTGIVTFKNAGSIAACARRTPLDRLMIETDSPYLTPEPHRKVRPNEPCYVVHVARFLADQRDMSLEDFVTAVDANAERFFGLNSKG